MSDDDVFSFLDQPALGAAATPESAPHVVDEFNTLMKEARCWPIDYPTKKKSTEHCVRFHYRRTNKSQAEAAFRSILLMYLRHVLKLNHSLEEDYPFLKQYFSQDPLGLVTYPDNNTHIYKNASKLVAAKQRLAEETQSEVADLSGTDPAEVAEDTSLEDTEAAISATTPVVEAGSSKPVGKASASPRKKRPSQKKRKKKKKAKTQSSPSSAPPPATIAETKTDDSTPSVTGKDAVVLTRVKSRFANVLAKLQLDLYTLLRANISKFMDKTCKGVLEAQIATYEQNNQLRNRDRMAIGKRYSWQKLKDDTYFLCCQMVTPGFYFLPLYTTPRASGQIVSKWCHVIRTIHANLVSFAPDWGALSERDAMKRLHSFLSPKELETIEKELQSNHKEVWEANQKSIREFFARTTLATAITLINEIDAAKFPHGYDPIKHTPDALKQTLYSYDELQKIKSRNSTELASLKNKLKQAEGKIAKLESDARKRTREPAPTGPPKPRKRPKAHKTTELSESSRKYQQLMKPGKRGDTPCHKCAKLGMRHFHDPEKCTPKTREQGLQRQKERQEAHQLDFPPPDDKRRYPKADYDSASCEWCKKEDVKPNFAIHPPDTCFRRPGGECDKQGCKTRGQRNRCVRKLLHELKKEKNQARKAKKGKQSEKARRGVRFKTTTMAVKPIVTPVANTTPAPAVMDCAARCLAEDLNQKPVPESGSESPEAEPPESPVPQENPPPDPKHVAAVAGGLAKLLPKPKPAKGGIVNKHDPLPSEGRKLRTKRYPKSEYATRQPLTHGELKFAMAQNAMAQPEHLRYQLERVGKEKNLILLRERIRAAEKEKARAKIAREIHASRKATRTPQDDYLSASASESYSDYSDSGSDYSRGRRPRKRRRDRRRGRRRGSRRRRRRKRGPARRPRRGRDSPSTRMWTPPAGHPSWLPPSPKDDALAQSAVPVPQPEATPIPSPCPSPPPSPGDANSSDCDPATSLPADTKASDVDVAAESSGTESSFSREYPYDPELKRPQPSSYRIVSNCSNCRTHDNNPTNCLEPLPNVWSETHATCDAALGSGVHPAEKAKRQKEVEWTSASLKDLPYGSWLPACSSISHKVSMPNTKQSPFNSSNNKCLPSETKGSRLLQVFMEYRDSTGTTRTGRVKLDTQSNGCYSVPGISLPRPWRPWEPKVVKGIGPDLIPLGDPIYFTIMKDGVPIKVDSNAPTPGVLTDGCVALLGLDVIYNLGIDIAYAIKHEKHMPVKYLSQQENLIDNRKLEAYAEYGKRGLAPAMIYKTCHLSERVVKQYLEKHPDDYVKKAINIGSVDINPGLPRHIRELITLLCKRFEDVFASHTNTLPPAMEGVEPHMFKMKDGYVHRMAPRPAFSPARAQAITEWLEWALEVGLVEPATNTSYASRLILAAKRKGSTPKSAPPDGIRVAWAGVDINEGITKTVPTYTDAWQQLYKVANLKYKFSADGLKQYWSIPLCQEAREITAFWTPRGLFQFTRMVMGTKNAATVAQNAYTRAMHTKLPKRSFPNLANFADDFLGGANTGESLVEVFEDFLIMCRKAKITLNPSKVRIGYEKEQFFGLTVDKGKIEPAMRNIDPVINMVYPKNRSELRSVMGIFNQFSAFIKDYGREGSPAVILNALVSPKAEWQFTDRHRKALDTLKRQVQQDIHLYAPDNTIPLVLETDGSDDGWGAVLYQIVDGEKRVIKMWSKQWKTEAWHKKPPYHREAKAWMNGMTLALPYAMCNPFPLQCWTDHSPLTWVKHTSGKGPVSQFIIDMLSQVDYEMNYLKGEDNVIADGLSRFPMLGPQKLMRTGLSNALDVLLATLLTADVDTTKIWFDARRDTKFLLPNLFDWCDARRKLNRLAHKPSKTCYQDALSESKLRKLKYTLGIWAPPADKICRQLRAAIKRDTPFACLIPSDLVDRICVDAAGTVSPDVQAAVNKAEKITFLAAGLTWLIHGIKLEAGYKQVYVNDRVTPEIELDVLTQQLANADRTPPLPACRTREDWVREQLRHRCADLWAHEPRVFTVQDGLLVYEPGVGEPLRTIVPRALQKSLIKYTHYSMCHMSAGKVFNVLKKRFHFEHMHKLCHEVVGDCALCNLLKARMKHAHKHFRAKLSIQPRTSYGADYYSVKKNKFGYNNILGIIDLATGNLVLRAVKGRNAANTAHTLFYDIVLNQGIPLRFHSDAAKEFLSTAMSSLQKLLGIGQSNTLAHNPKSNAKIERVWEFVGRALRAMTPEQYAYFHLYMPIIAHVWNCTPDSDTKISPFEAEHGMRCRSVAESVLQNPPPEGLPASASDLKSIAVAAAAFNEVISNIKAVERANTANKLNTYGDALKEYRVGDKVAFYLPPNEAESLRMGKNPKHMLQYQGPAEIVESLSNNNTAFKLKCGNRTYKRNIMHIAPYTSSGRVPAELQLKVDTSITPGSFVAVLDDTSDKKYHIAKVLDVGEQATTLHYYATKTRKIRNAKWRPLYAHPRSNVIQMEQPDTIIRNDLKYTGTIDTRPLDDSLILLPNVGMTDRRCINGRTRTILRSKTGYSHHVLLRSWNPANDNRE